MARRRQCRWYGIGMIFAPAKLNRLKQRVGKSHIIGDSRSLGREKFCKTEV